MGEIIELSIPSTLESLDAVSPVIEDAVARSGFDDVEAGRIQLAIWEAIVNAVQHGNRSRANEPVELKFVIGTKNIEVTIRDHGIGFVPAALPDPRAPDRLLEPSSRGVFLMRAYMDEVEYATHPCGGTIVRMSKGG
ncbi:ATP-binding protein [Pendulispora rubella]|uniref:ATP-binding protein n=1 Tax=Pendulispora rubella TaxID=2741070 RepID=A0ABZ2LBP2_9BACT